MLVLPLTGTDRKHQCVTASYKRFYSSPVRDVWYQWSGACCRKLSLYYPARHQLQPFRSQLVIWNFKCREMGSRLTNIGIISYYSIIFKVPSGQLNFRRLWAVIQCALSVQSTTVRGCPQSSFLSEVLSSSELVGLASSRSPGLASFIAWYLWSSR